MKRILAICSILLACNGDIAPGDYIDAGADSQTPVADAYVDDGIHCPPSFGEWEFTSADCVGQSNTLYCTYRRNGNEFHQPSYLCANGCAEDLESCNP
ncbi:hypothetical protein ACFL0V_02300 [Nanoarchaeota archaeon]